MDARKAFAEYTTLREWLLSTEAAAVVPECVREAAWTEHYRLLDVIADAPPADLAVIRMKVVALGHMLAEEVAGHVTAARAFASILEGLEQLSAAGAEGEA